MLSSRYDSSIFIDSHQDSINFQAPRMLLNCLEYTWLSLDAANGEGEGISKPCSVQDILHTGTIPFALCSGTLSQHC